MVVERVFYSSCPDSLVLHGVHLSWGGLAHSQNALCASCALCITHLTRRMERDAFQLSWGGQSQGTTLKSPIKPLPSLSSSTSLGTLLRKDGSARPQGLGTPPLHPCLPQSCPHPGHTLNLAFVQVTDDMR